MSLVIAPRRLRAPQTLWSRVARAGVVAVGWALIGVGLIGAVLPGHLGVPVLVLGLILVLRSSRAARKVFIGLQRRHPRIVYPIRRLLRRNPAVFAVAWQQALRFEKLILPRKWRSAKVMRRWLVRRWRRRRRMA